MNIPKHKVIISLASNSDAKANLDEARIQLSRFISDMRFSSEIWTNPVGTKSRKRYLNQLCTGQTTIPSAEKLNKVLKDIEQLLGRTRNEDGIVTIDLDLMRFDDSIHHVFDWDRDYIKRLYIEL